MKNIKVTIGIPSFNEEKNIKKLLSSIYKQKQIGFDLEKIIVIIDGATDKTEDKVRSFHKRNILIITNQKRQGKTHCLNQLIQKFNTDVLVLFDADIVLKTPTTISKLIQPLSDKKIGLTGGSLIQENNSKFIEKSIGITLSVYEDYLKTIKNGNNVFAIKGAILALSKNFAKKVKIPSDVFADDAYLYFCCITQGFKFKYISKATAWYKVPSNINDQITQNSRWYGSEENLKKYFGNLVTEEYSRKNKLFYLLLIKAFIKKPAHSILIFGINLYALIYAQRRSNSQSSVWKISSTTKT